jgi:hypothetical protein
MFLLVTAASGKGYPALLGIGLFLLGLRRGGFKAEISAVVFALVFWLFPVRAYLHDGFVAALGHASGFFTDVYFNHSFLNTFLHVSGRLAAPGRMAMGALTLAVAAGSWWHARRALARDDEPMSTWWLGMFATAALLFPMGMSTLSYLYNQILILPGVLLLFTAGEPFWKSCGLPASTIRAIFALECVAGFLLFKYLLFNWNTPLAGFGNVVLVILLALAVAIRFAADRKRVTVGGAVLASQP